jgi:hypothetical protein
VIHLSVKLYAEDFLNEKMSANHENKLLDKDADEALEKKIK